MDQRFDPPFRNGAVCRQPSSPQSFPGDQGEEQASIGRDCGKGIRHRFGPDRDVYRAGKEDSRVSVLCLSLR